MEQEIYFVSVSPDYFSTLKIAMLAGRPFQEGDSQGAKPVAIVNRTFADMYFPAVNPVGYHVASADAASTWKEIVGVVSDFRQRNPEEDLRPLAYFPVAQTLPGRWSMAIRIPASNDIANTAQHISNWHRPVDPQLYWEMGSVQLAIHDSESLTLRRPIITLLASFGGLAPVLVVVGVFGVTSYSVAERTREIGIRVAFGAARREIAGLVLRESLGVTLAGLAMGTFGAFALTRFFPTEGVGWSGSGIFLLRHLSNRRCHSCMFCGVAGECCACSVLAACAPRDARRSNGGAAVRMTALERMVTEDDRHFSRGES